MFISLLEKTSIHKWAKIVENSKWLLPIHDAYGSSEIKIYSSAIFHINGYKYGRLLWRKSQNRIEIEISNKHHGIIYEGIQEIAKELGGEVYHNKNLIFDIKKHIPIPQVKINRKKIYFESQNLDSLKWIAIRQHDRSIIMETLKVKHIASLKINLALKSGNIILTPNFSGWTFLIGNDLHKLFAIENEPTTEESLNKLCLTLQKLSGKLVEVQYFEHNVKSNISGYLQAKNGKFIFGYWKSENEEFVKGKLPKNIKNYHPTSTHEIASIWSISSNDFIYLEELIQEKCLIIDTL